MAMARKIKATTEKDEGITIYDAYEEFIAEKITYKVPKTVENYKQSFRLFMEYFQQDEKRHLDENSPVKDITEEHFYQWIEAMKKRLVKGTTINHYLRDCRVFIYWCQHKDRKYIFPPYKIHMVAADEDVVKHFRDDEIDVILAKPSRSASAESFVEWRTWAIANWIYATGNREATVVDVRIEDLDFRRKEIVLRHTKDKKAHIIPMASSLETVLKEYIRYFRRGYTEGWLFPNVGDEKLTTGALRSSFANYCKKRGSKHKNPHGLRHSFAKEWVKSGGSAFGLKKMLGHSDITVSQRYVKLFSDDLKEDFERFNPLDKHKKAASRKKTISVDDD